MKKSKYILPVLFLLILAATGCEDRSDLTAPAPVATGSVSFARFVTIGNSITAGYQSGALYQTAQDYSFGKLIANQVGGVTYAIPYYSDPGTGGRIEVKAVTPAFATKTNTAVGAPTNSTYALPYNNLGIPGATAYDIVNASTSTNCFQAVNGGGPNPMFDLVLRGQGSQFRQAKAQNPTFLTLWIGNNDILGYATAGGTRPYTPVVNFTAIYNQLADSIASLNTKVVAANIPNVTTIPFFTTVGGQLMMAGVTKVWAQRSDNSIAYVSLTQNMLTLQASSLMYDATGNPTGIGMVASKPFPNAVVLDSGEVGTALSVIAQYNSVIASAAAAKGFELVDVNTLFNQYAAATQSSAGGIMVDGVLFSVVFVKGNMFSLDGVHPSNQGHAILANEFIKKINAKWGAAIPRINVANIPGGLLFGKELKMSEIGIPIFPKGAFDKLLF